jgi:hypothetical protein
VTERAREKEVCEKARLSPHVILFLVLGAGQSLKFKSFFQLHGFQRMLEPYDTLKHLSQACFS